MFNLEALLNKKLILENGTNWSIGPETKKFLFHNVNDQVHSIETGIGYSTFIFAAQSAQHTVCFPNASVEKSIREYLSNTEITLDNVKFVVGKSQYTLPSIKDTFNFALIDGDHMFPSPMIDFYYINNLLEIKGLLIIDDLQIPSVRLLYDFLIVSRKWYLIQILDGERTCVFRKLDFDPYEWFGLQEYNRITKLKSVKDKIKALHL